ncbi:MAG TPA: arabinofuranosidase catalytic domain-containing protein [Polyangia bacterium]|nr:arabinofuranosidase catalytic domain-containing protein [Polyangia bacterium]
MALRRAAVLALLVTVAPMGTGCAPSRPADGNTSTGGAPGSGGSPSSGSGGDSVSTGGSPATGSGGSSSTGGTTGSSGGSTGTGGVVSTGGTPAGGAPGTGGARPTGGASGAAGLSGTGGSSPTGGSSGAMRACDIYQAANTPCVAAHSTVRALFGGYTGALYQVRRASDKTTKDVPVGAGGFVDVSVQDTFCSGTTCTISIIYDQSANHNDLAKSPKALWLPNGGNEANASDGKIMIGGHVAHGVDVNNPTQNVGYRNNATKGLAKGDAGEAMYMVVDGTRYSTICCFDYGNVETSGVDDGNATMEALYWGASTQWTRGGGNGPWMAADLENGMFEGNSNNVASNTSITGWAYVTGMLKGPSGNSFALKAGNAQSGALQTKWNGARPPGYTPMKKEGAIVLGTGGDGSNYGQGTFFEGAITTGNPPDATDDAIQADIVNAGYGK